MLHSSRRELGLSIDEYARADTVHKLSGVHSPVPGWCIASKPTLARALDLSRSTTFRIIKRLAAKNLLEIDPTTRHLRTTKRWHDIVEVTKTQVFGSE